MERETSEERIISKLCFVDDAGSTLLVVILIRDVRANNKERLKGGDERNRRGGREDRVGSRRGR